MYSAQLCALVTQHVLHQHYGGYHCESILIKFHHVPEARFALSLDCTCDRPRVEPLATESHTHTPEAVTLQHTGIREGSGSAFHMICRTFDISVANLADQLSSYEPRSRGLHFW